MDFRNSYNNNSFISESNYTEFFEETLMKMKNDKAKQIYKLDEREREIYEQQEKLGKEMLELISKNQKDFKHKYNIIEKRDEFYHKEYNIFNDKIKNILNQYKNTLTQNNIYSNSNINSNSNMNQNNYFTEDNINYNLNNNINNKLNNNINYSLNNKINYNLNNNINIIELFDEFDNRWVFPKNNLTNDKKFKEKCNIKSCEKKIIKIQNNNNMSNISNNKSGNKSFARAKSKTTNRKSVNSSINIFKTNNNKNKNINNLKQFRTERKPNFQHYNDIKPKIKERAKSRTTRTTIENIHNISNSNFENNKTNNNFKFILISEPRNNKNEINPQNLKRPDYSKYLTRDNFYPKSYRIDSNKQRLTSDEIFYETKASLTDNRIMKELYDKAFKKCDYQYSLYNNDNRFKRTYD